MVWVGDDDLPQSSCWVSGNNHLFCYIKHVRRTAATVRYCGGVIPLSVGGPAGNEGARAARTKNDTGGAGVDGLRGRKPDLVSLGLPCRLHVAPVIGSGDVEYQAYHGVHHSRTDSRFNLV